MTKPRLYLHIGYNKTGTTSLQFSLGQNRDLLLRHGICFARNDEPSENKHTRLSGAARRAARAPEGKGELAEVFGKIAEEILASGCAIAMLSEESFSFLPKAGIEALAEVMADFDVRIVGTVRRQDAWLESWYLQSVKEGRDNCSFLDFLRRPWAQLDYAKAWRVWADAFGPDALRILSFDLANAQPGRIHRALVDVVTEGKLTDTLKELHWNRGFPPVTMELLRRMSRVADLPVDRHAYMETLRVFRAQNGKHLTHPVFTKTHLRPWVQHEILARYGDANAAFREAFFGNVDPFPDFNAEGLPPVSEDDPRGALFTHAEIAFAAMEMVRLAMAAQDQDQATPPQRLADQLKEAFRRV